MYIKKKENRIGICFCKQLEGMVRVRVSRERRVVEGREGRAVGGGAGEKGGGNGDETGS